MVACAEPRTWCAVELGMILTRRVLFFHCLSACSPASTYPRIAVLFHAHVLLFCICIDFRKEETLMFLSFLLSHTSMPWNSTQCEKPRCVLPSTLPPFYSCTLHKTPCAVNAIFKAQNTFKWSWSEKTFVSLTIKIMCHCIWTTSLWPRSRAKIYRADIHIFGHNRKSSQAKLIHLFLDGAIVWAGFLTGFACSPDLFTWLRTPRTGQCPRQEAKQIYDRQKPICLSNKVPIRPSAKRSHQCTTFVRCCQWNGIVNEGDLLFLECL